MIEVRSYLDALEARHVEQHGTTGHLVADVLDTELLRTARIDEFGVIAIVHLVIENNVAKRIPLRRRLTRHVDRIVRVTEIRRWDILIACRGVSAGRQHGVDRIPTAAEQARLNRLLQGQAEREDLALLDQLPRVDEVLGAHIVSVPIWSSAPQRPQFESFLAAS